MIPYNINDSRQLANDNQDLVTLTVSLPTNGTETPDAAPGSCYDNWSEPNHLLYQIAHVALLAGFLAPTTAQGLLIYHACCIIAYLLLSSWSWVMLCAADVFSWNFSLCAINVVQMFYIFYHLRPVTLPGELALIYASMFEPLKVSRAQFKRFIAPERCSVLTLHQGEPYATQDVTKTDRLSILLSGTVNVLSNGQFLHQIQERQFLDSPEFESSTHGEDKFHVSIIAATPCRYICWQRQSLQYFFAKDPYVALVLGHILGRDITNKLYLLNERLKLQKGSRVDIRLPNVSSAALSGIDLTSDNNPGSGIADIHSDIDDVEEEDLLDELNEKMPMFPNGIPHAKLHLSSSTFSSASSR
ncbi:hypothetical protein LSH36_157g02011 [Paralvinella palmiformis]|uniref:POPDC1-3 domain-containing protein n=1 Tax=Paralvinella palmiformis TaxID=53620 RepID=A0AAD9JTK7_9ANNE|nr:hypothetical protein LSH36_157g02011 [Paralvinella palmiformis]